MAACYYEPCAAFAEERLFESMAAAAARLDPGLAERAHSLGKAFAADTLEVLLVDYTRLFVGPSDVYAKPYGSVWLAEEGADVRSMYAEAGFDVDESLHERPDHIAVELEFLYRLVHQQAAADLHGRFVDRHLAKWVARFSAAVQAGAETAFYRGLAQLTEEVVNSESITSNGRRG